jgi:ureidoglycolate hydrolase
MESHKEGPSIQRNHDMLSLSNNGTAERLFKLSTQHENQRISKSELSIFTQSMQFSKLLT